MQRPSFGDWLIPFVLSAITLVTAWVGHNVKVEFWEATCAYVGLFIVGILAHLFKVREYKKWLTKNSVVMTSFEAKLVKLPDEPGSGHISLDLTGPQTVEQCILKVTNLSSRRVKVDSLWLDKCGQDGHDLPFSDRTLPRILEIGDDYMACFPKQALPREDWFDRGRARMSDGTVISSSKDLNPPTLMNVQMMTKPVISGDPRSPRPPKRGP